MTELEQIANIIKDLGGEARMAFFWWLVTSKVMPYLIPCSLIAFLGVRVSKLMERGIALEKMSTQLKEKEWEYYRRAQELEARISAARRGVEL